MARTKAAMIAARRSEQQLADKTIPEAKRPKLTETSDVDLTTDHALHSINVDPIESSVAEEVTNTESIPLVKDVEEPKPSDLLVFKKKRNPTNVTARDCVIYKEDHKVWTPETFPKPDDGFIYVVWKGNENGVRHHLIKANVVSDFLWKMLAAAHQHELYQGEVFSRIPFATVARECSEEVAETLRQAFTITYKTDSTGEDTVTTPPGLYTAVEEVGTRVETNCRVDLKHVRAYIEIDEGYTYEGYDYCPQNATSDEEDDA